MGLSAARLNRELRNNSLGKADTRRLNVILAEVEQEYLNKSPLVRQPSHRLRAYLVQKPNVA